VLTKTSYYSFERLEGDGFDCLIRFDGATFERASAGRWIEDSDVGRRIVFPGADGAEAVDEKTARKLAQRYCVEL
jgi:hypothetical protein